MVGISSSPNIGGNVDRMVQYILERSGKPSYFVNLSNISYYLAEPALISVQEIIFAKLKMT